MWYHGFGSRTQIDAGASPRFFLLFLFLHGLTGLAVFLAQLPPWLLFFLLAFNALALRWHLLCWAFPFIAHEATALVLEPGGRLYLVDEQGERRHIPLRRVEWSSQALLILKIGPTGGGWLVLAADGVEADSLRRLRTRLRWDRVDREARPLGQLFPARPVGRDQHRIPRSLRR